MSRIVANGAKVAVAALFLGLAGCDGGSIEEGMPKDLTPAVDIKANADMKNSSRSAPPSAAPAKGAGAPAATPPKD